MVDRRVRSKTRGMMGREKPRRKRRRRRNKVGAEDHDGIRRYGLNGCTERAPLYGIEG